MASPSFQPPWDDEILLTDRCRLHYTEAISVEWAGGPAGWIPGTLWLSGERLAFRPDREPAHFWSLTVPRLDVLGVSLIETAEDARLKLTLRSLRGPVRCEVAVARAAMWAKRLLEPFAPAGDTRERLQAALERGERDVHRYVGLLLELSFPRGDWHVELIDDMRDVCGTRLAELGIQEQASFWHDAEQRARQAEADGDEAGRSEQIASICTAVGTIDGRSFRRYGPLPDWPHGEPVWLWLSVEEDRRLRELGVLTPVT